MSELDSAPGFSNGKRDARYHMLDIWRGVACLMVVIYHGAYALEWTEVGDSWLRWAIVYATKRMDLGVPLFFVISGYCIAASAESSARRGDSPLAFIAKRFWRIYPPYWIALLGFVVVLGTLDILGYSRYFQGPLGVVLDAPWQLDHEQWVGNLTLTESWRPHFFQAERNVYTGVAWSLCFEEQFYFLCFLALCIAPRRLMSVLAGITIALASVRIYAWWVGGLCKLSGCFPLLWHEFAVGLIVYYRLMVVESAWVKRLIELGLAVLFAIGLLTQGRETATAASFGLALILLKQWDARSLEIRLLEPFRACGRRCYSIYLVHLPASVIGNPLLYEMGLTTFWERTLVMIPLVSIVGIALGWSFHEIVESYFLGVPQKLGLPLFGRSRRAVPAGLESRA